MRTLIIENGRHRRFMFPICDQCCAAGILGHVGSLHLGEHSAAAETARALGHCDILADIVHFLDQFCARLFRVPVIKSVNTGQDHKMICLDHLGDLGSQTVIVTDTDFFGRDRIVLVHDRQDTALQQAVYRVLGVQEALAFLHVLEGDEHLCDIESEFVRDLLVGIQQ